MDIVEKVARLISEQDRIEADEASDFADWHWEERADLARKIIEAVRPSTDQIVADARTAIRIHDGVHRLKDALEAIAMAQTRDDSPLAAEMRKIALTALTPDD